jgi:glutamine synthetase
MFSKFSRSVRKVTAQQVRTMAVSFDGYGQHVFRGAVAAPYLEKAGLPANTLDSNAWTTNGQADKVAAAVLEWAKDNGASVYCHWFQPLGSSAFRHGMSGQVQNTMLEFNSAGKPVWDFKGKNILKGETDGSSYPNGGLRATHTAGAYLSVDPTSPIFLRGDTIFIPASMVSYYGHALDEKTPLLRASDALSKQGARLLNLLGYKSVKGLSANIGLEQVRCVRLVAPPTRACPPGFALPGAPSLFLIHPLSLTHHRH